MCGRNCIGNITNTWQRLDASVPFLKKQTTRFRHGLFRTVANAKPQGDAPSFCIVSLCRRLLVRRVPAQQRLAITMASAVPSQKDCEDTIKSTARERKSASQHSKSNMEPPASVFVTTNNTTQSNRSAAPLLLPKAKHPLPLSKNSQETEGQGNQASFVWPANKFNEKNVMSRSTMLVQDCASTTNSQQPSQPSLDEAVSLLLSQPPSVRFALQDEVCYYEAEPNAETLPAEEGFQMDHVFDDIEKVAAAPPMVPPRRRPSIESLQSQDEDQHVPLDSLALVRAAIPRHGSVGSETTLSLSGHGGSSSDQDDHDEDTFSVSSRSI